MTIPKHIQDTFNTLWLIEEIERLNEATELLMRKYRDNITWTDTP